MFRFDLYQMGHGISFNIGTGGDGSPLLSYSTLCALYQLPDGSKWAEHVDYFDMDDLQQHGKKLGRRDWRRSVPLSDHDEDKELLRLMGRKHTVWCGALRFFSLLRSPRRPSPGSFFFYPISLHPQPHFPNPPAPRKINQTL